MSYSQKYSLVSFLEPIETDTQFSMSGWPLHITLADTFAIELSADVINQLKDLVEQQKLLRLSVENDVVLGTTKVSLIKKDNELQKFHNKIVDILEKNGAVFNNPEFTRKGFLPHSTIQKSGKLNYGDEFTVTSLSLVDMFPDGDWQERKILHNFEILGFRNSRVKP